MLKSVEGLETLENSHFPDLKKAALEMLQICEDELKDSASRITLRLNLRPEYKGTWVLEFEMNDELFGKKTIYLIPATLCAMGDRWVRNQVRAMHSEILNDYLNRRVEEYKKNIAEVVEA